MFKHWRVKLFAFFIHLIFSVLIIGLFILVITQFWFPDVLFSLENVWDGLKILVLVDAILGPLLTMMLFVPGKKGLKSDLIIIVLVQIAALIYGGWIIYQQRPEVMVFNIEQFEIITAAKYDRENLDTKYFPGSERPYPFIVYAVQEAITEEEKKNFFLSFVFYKKAVHYRPLTAYRSVLAEKALKIDKFNPKSNYSKRVLKDFRTEYDVDKVLLFKLEGTTIKSTVIILDKSSLKILGYLDIDAWDNYDNSE